MGNNNKMTEKYVQKIWVKNVVMLGWFPFWQAFVFRVLLFCFEHFLTILMENNNKNDRKSCTDGLGAKRSHHVLVFNFCEFSYQMT